MHVSELIKKIQKSIKSSLSHKELVHLCSSLKLSTTGKKLNLQDRLTAFVNKQSYDILDKISSEIDNIVNVYNYKPRPIHIQNNRGEYICDDLSLEVLNTSLTNLEPEVPQNLRKHLVVVNFTQYQSCQSTVHIKSVPGINERNDVVSIPNNLLYVKVQKSPFYCCAVCLHPLSFLIPQQSPKIPCNSRITSRFHLNFYISPTVFELLNSQKIVNKNKTIYKWQVVLRFISIDPSKQLPNPNESANQCIPPYLTISVNGENVPLWEILPSNCKAKEGRRHPKPVNITDKLSIMNSGQNGYKQNCLISWWQTPEVFQYYYVGVYLERKLFVGEILNLFKSNRKDNLIPMHDTQKLIRNKLGSGSKDSFCGGGDDLVISSVLPVSLSCPIGRSRIEIPLRTLKCQHLQCFDALLFISMNERRSQWKCPICECRATPIDLFLCKFTENILQDFKNDDEVVEVNVNIDGTYVPIRQKDKVDREKPDKAQDNPNEIKAVVEEMPTIILDSDDEDEQPIKSNKNDKSSKSKESISDINKDQNTNVANNTIHENENRNSPSVRFSKSPPYIGEPMETDIPTPVPAKTKENDNSLNLNSNQRSDNPFYTNANSLYNNSYNKESSSKNINLFQERYKSNNFNQVILAPEINLLKQKRPVECPIPDHNRLNDLTDSDDESINSGSFASASSFERENKRNDIEKYPSINFSVSNILGTTPQSENIFSIQKPDSTTQAQSKQTEPQTKTIQENHKSIIPAVTIDLTDDLEEPETPQPLPKGSNTSIQPLVHQNENQPRHPNNTAINERCRDYSVQMNSTKWIPLNSNQFKEARATISNSGINRPNGIKKRCASINHMRLNFQTTNLVTKKPAQLQGTIDLTSDDEPPSKKSNDNVQN